MTQTICARCKGLVVAGSDAYGPYIHCVSCGRQTDLLAPTPEALALLTKRGGSVSEQGMAECERCKYTWVLRSTMTMPRACPKCRSPYWDRPRGGSERVADLGAALPAAPA